MSLLLALVGAVTPPAPEPEPDPATAGAGTGGGDTNKRRRLLAARQQRDREQRIKVGNQAAMTTTLAILLSGVLD